VRAGHYLEPFSLERVTQNVNNTFMERSLVDTFAPARNMGVMAFGWAESELSTWQIGTFRTNSDNVGNDSFDSGQALTMRGTWLPFYDEESEGRRYLHLGAAYSYRATQNNQVRFRNTPEIRKAQPGQNGHARSPQEVLGLIFVDLHRRRARAGGEAGSATRGRSGNIAGIPPAATLGRRTAVTRPSAVAARPPAPRRPMPGDSRRRSRWCAARPPGAGRR